MHCSPDNYTDYHAFIDARMQHELHLIEQHNLLIRELLRTSHLHMDYIITSEA